MLGASTDHAKQIMLRAEEEAQILGNDQIDTQHILLGLLATSTGRDMATRILRKCGVDWADVYAKLARVLNLGEPRSPRLGLTESADRVISHAKEEARMRSPSLPFVGSEHLLLGLLREQGSVAARVLANLGIEPEDAREELAELEEAKRAIKPPSDLATPPRTYASATVVRARQHAEEQFLVEIREKRARSLNTGHMLLGFLNDPDSIAAKAIARLGVDKAKLCDQVTELLGSDREE